MKWYVYWGAVLLCAIATVLNASSALRNTVVHRTVKPARGLEKVYVVDHAKTYISPKQIRRDIPAWERAANRDFSPIWHTPQVQIILVRKAPAGAIVAVFQQKGDIQGALAFHDVERGVPHITVYAGTSHYYGYDISTDFTHELFETLGDPTISQTNQGYPYPYFYIGPRVYPQAPGTVWSNEVSDAVEKYAYRISGVPISDFITPNWFNDHVSGPYDFMGIVQQPFQIAKGGYSCFYVSTWTCVENFRHAGPDAAGFYKGEHGAR